MNTRFVPLIGFLIFSILSACSGRTSSLFFGHPSIDAYQSQLVAYYKFEESSSSRTDSYGTNTLTDGNAVLSGTGKNNTGADFESTLSNYFFVTNANTTMKPTTSFAISAWIKLESSPAADMYIFRSLVGANSDIALYLTSGTGLVGTVRQADAQVKTVSIVSYSFQTATWYHVALTGNAASLQLYINGALQGSAGYSDVIVSDSGAYIGASSTTTGHFDGIIDELGFWSNPAFGTTAAMDAFVSALYNSGTGRFP